MRKSLEAEDALFSAYMAMMDQREEQERKRRRQR